MGDTSPKNIHKLAEKKHEEQIQKVEHKHENAENQHHHKKPEETESEIEPLAE